MSRPSPRGRRSASRGRADGNIAAVPVSHGQHVPMPTAAAAWHANTVMSKAAWWPWPFDLESGVRVTCDVGCLCANFGLPRPLFSSYVWCTRQTKVSLNAPPNRGGGIGPNNHLAMAFSSVTVLCNIHTEYLPVEWIWRNHSTPLWPVVFIAHQHAMHAERDIVLPITSIRLSNVSIVPIGMDISSHFLTFCWGNYFSLFVPYHRQKIPMGTPLGIQVIIIPDLFVSFFCFS